MKRLSTKLISSSKITTSSTSISCSSSISKSLIQNLKPCSNSNALLYKPYKTHLYKNPSQDYTTHVGIRLYFPSNESRNKEAMDYLRKSLEIKEFLMGKDSREFGDANREFAGACVGSKNFKDGLSYCLKALEIHLRLFGENSLEVAHDRRLLGVIYVGLEEYEKAVEENRLAQKLFRICGCSEDVIRVGIDAANMLIARWRYEAAMKTLKEHEKVVEENSENPFILMTMGKALIHRENFEDAKGCLEMEKSKLLEVAGACVKIAAEIFALAKIYFSLGPNHNDSIHTCQNLSNAYDAYAAMNRWSNCGRTTEIVKSFKSAIISERYIVLPTPASLAYSWPIYHIDSNFVDSRKNNLFQIGTVARSQEGDVLWAMISVVDMDLLMPYSLKMKMKAVDINMAEIAGFGYITIHAHEHGISDFLVFTDSKLSRDYLNSKKKQNFKQVSQILSCAVKTTLVLFSNEWKTGNLCEKL